MNFNNTYKRHISKFIFEEVDDEEKDNDEEDTEEVEDNDGDKEDNKEENSLDETGNEIIDSKKLDIITGQVEITLIDTKEKYRLHIKFLDDAKYSGYVQYDNHDDAKRTFQGINTVGELLNYINIHAETDSSIAPALNIMKREIISIKRDMEPDEIADLALEFPI